MQYSEGTATGRVRVMQLEDPGIFRYLLNLSSKGGKDEYRWFARTNRDDSGRELRDGDYARINFKQDWPYITITGSPISDEEEKVVTDLVYQDIKVDKFG